MISRADTRLTDDLIARWVEVPHGTVPTLADLLKRNACKCGDREAFVDVRERVTWSALYDRTRRVAAGLLDLGIRKGDVVGIQLPNRIEFVVAMAAINQIGAVVCPYDSTLREREIEFMLRFSGAVGTFVDDDRSSFDHVALIRELAPALPALRHVIATNDEGGPGGFCAFSKLVTRELDAETEAELERRVPSLHDVNRLMFTSGSTGDPKGVLHTYATTIYGNYRVNEHMQIDEEDVILLFVPAALNWGMFQVLQTIIAGCRMVMMEKFEPAAVLDTIASERVTTFGTPPTGLAALLRQPDISAHALESMRLVTTGGSACPVDLLRSAREKLRCRVMEPYGMTEVGWISATALGDSPEEMVGTVGKPFPWMPLRLRDEEGRDLPAGEIGQIAVTGPCVCVGYYRNEDRNAEVFTEDGWFLTGDLGIRDTTGRLRLVGRLKDIIKHGGSTVLPQEVEEILYTHPKIQDVAVVGVPDEYFGENGCACVIPREGETLNLDELVDFLEPRIAKYKCPQRLEIMERFPRTSTGKVQKHTLRKWVLSAETGGDPLATSLRATSP